MVLRITGDRLVTHQWFLLHMVGTTRTARGKVIDGPTGTRDRLAFREVRSQRNTVLANCSVPLCHVIHFCKQNRPSLSEHSAHLGLIILYPRFRWFGKMIFSYIHIGDMKKKVFFGFLYFESNKLSLILRSSYKIRYKDLNFIIEFNELVKQTTSPQVRLSRNMLSISAPRTAQIVSSAFTRRGHWRQALPLRYQLRRKCNVQVTTTFG